MADTPDIVDRIRAAEELENRVCIMHDYAPPTPNRGQQEKSLARVAKWLREFEEKKEISNVH